MVFNKRKFIVALVTGGSRGIGKAIATALCEAGASVYVIGKTKENLQILKSENPNIKTVQVDLENWNDTRLAVEKLGHIDMLVNNAAMHVKKSFLEVDKESFDKQIQVNMMAIVNISQVIAKSMIGRGNGGAIVNISSIRSVIPSGRSFGYPVTKAGVDMITKCMALELGPYNIRVNSVNPTYVKTDMTKAFLEGGTKALHETIKSHPLGHFARLEDVTNGTLFLLSDNASMITGTSLKIDGGYTIA
ncbi:hypothetical protein KUTeg_013041 [Tegillarca granosa]|uniref:L-xylulose reductase n=1 Tax=Tegillarca granosa TaxID=220873 RepID=A0ABQ9ESJ1_TEGGR|nr:hypothetical protein KUTeg_013041 [Tegillarca granosa]